MHVEFVVFWFGHMGVTEICGPIQSVESQPIILPTFGPPMLEVSATHKDDGAEKVPIAKI